MKTKRHLHNSHWLLVGLVLASAGIVALFFVTDSSPKEHGGRWYQDSRGVWIPEGEPGQKPAAVRQQEFLIREAQLAYQVVKDENRDLSAGPCLGVIFQDWVADVVHVPREDTDNDQKNQCEQYQRGEVSHFIELSLDGSVVRVQ